MISIFPNVVPGRIEEKGRTEGSNLELLNNIE
jgi:hypothetical protein